MQYDPQLTNVSQPMSAPQPTPLASPAPPMPQDVAVRCPHCGSAQFFGRRKITGIGWTLYILALVNIPISLLLMFVLIGFVTIFASPVLALIGFYGCRKLVNTCARCKRDF